MITLVLLSAGAAFAEDNVTDDVIAVDDEIAIDDTLAAEDDGEVLDAAEVVTSENFNNYFDEAGTLLKNVTADELTFEGNFKDVSIDIGRAITLKGNNAVLDQGSISISAANVTVSGFTINQNNWTSAVFVVAPDVTVSDNTINFNDSAAPLGIAVDVMDSNNFNLINNVINYVGSTDGSYVNNAIRIVNSNGTQIRENKFKLSLVSFPIGWAESPAGSGNWVSSPMSEGIVVDSSDYVLFDGNVIDMTYNKVAGDYDTIYTVDFKNSDVVIISNNNITSKGHTFIYGIIISGQDFIISCNNIDSSSDVDYANGIDIEGPATGLVDENVISAKGINSAYPIYSGMNGQDVSASYTNNEISGEAYLVIGMSLGDVNNEISGNEIFLNGNYTTGIAYKGANTTITNNQIVLISSEEGNESIWEAFGVEAVGIKIISSKAIIDNNTVATAGKGVSLAGNTSEVDLTNNFINVAGNEDKDAYAIYATDIAKLDVSKNTIDYQGTSRGAGVNNGVLIEKVNGAAITDNIFRLELVSLPINWVEEPAGSWNYVSYVMSEGILVKDSDDVVFKGNAVNTTLGDAIGEYDTIYAIDFKNSNNALINDNDIEALGHTYIYAIQISGNNFNISENNISATSDNYYANGIDVEGPATGVIESNGILAKGVTLSYPIYSGMNGQNVSVTYSDNDLVGEAYFVLGMSLGDVESTIVGNGIYLTGNYTTGIAYKGSKLTVNENVVFANASNVGNESIWETFGVETTGIKVVAGDADITNNNVKTTGEYTVKLGDTNSSVTDNFLAADELVGDASVNYTGDAVVKDNKGISTVLSYSASKTVLLTAIKKGSYFNIVLKDEKGNVLSGQKVTITFNGKTKVATTDKNGAIKYKLAATKTGTKKLTIEFKGNGVYDAVAGLATIKITKEKTKFTAKKKTFKTKTKTKKYTVTLKDSKKKAIKKVKVTIKVNGKTYKAKTNSKGKATFKITKLNKRGKFTAKIKFAGNKYYKAAQKSVKITVKK